MNTKNSLQNKLARSYKSSYIILARSFLILQDIFYTGASLHFTIVAIVTGWVLFSVRWQEVVVLFCTPQEAVNDASLSMFTNNSRDQSGLRIWTNQVWEYIKTLMNGVSALPTLHPRRQSVINWLQCIIHLHHILLCSDPGWFRELGLFTCFVPYCRLNVCTVASHVTLDTEESITIFCQLLQVSGCNLVNCSGLHFITYLVGGLPRIWCGIRWPQLCCCWAVYMSSCSALNQGSWLPPLVWRHKQLLY